MSKAVAGFVRSEADKGSVYLNWALHILFHGRAKRLGSLEKCNFWMHFFEEHKITVMINVATDFEITVTRRHTSKIFTSLLSRTQNGISRQNSCKDLSYYQASDTFSTLQMLHCLSPTPYAQSLHHSSRVSFTLRPVSSKSAVVCIQSSLSDTRPPTSKEEAVLQAKTSLSTTLQKPLNNPRLAVGRIKKLKQPRFRVEIPLVDDSENSLTKLAFDVLGDIAIKRKSSPVKLLMLWPNASLSEAATQTFDSTSASQVEHIDIDSVDNIDARLLNSADVAVFLALDASKLATLKTLTDALYPKPVVIFNPTWSFEDESNFGELNSFVGSFEVVYSFMGLEVRGILSKRKGMIFKCVRDGVVSSERWNVFVEEKGELKAVSSVKTRPSLVEVETLLYNLMAVNSPITKSARFIRDLVSNVTGKK